MINSRFASLRRPMFVKAPFGIVTTVEVCFTAMFVALMVWSLVNYLYISYTNLTLYIDDGVEMYGHVDSVIIDRIFRYINILRVLTGGKRGSEAYR